MATLPKRIASRPRGGAIQRPTKENLTQVRSTQDPGVQATSGAFGELEAQGISDVGTALTNVAAGEQARQDRLTKAALRIQTQEDQVYEDRSLGEYNRDIEETFNSINAGEDLSFQTNVDAAAAEFETKAQEAVSNYAGSEDGRRKFASKIEKSKNTVLMRTIKRSGELRNSIILNQLNADIAQRKQALAANPSLEGLQTAMDELAGTATNPGLIEERESVLKQEQENSLLAETTTDFYKTAVRGMMIKQDTASLRKLLSEQRSLEALGAEEYQLAVKNLQELETGIFEDSKNEQAEKIADLEAVVGPLSDLQKKKVLDVPLEAKEKLNEVKELIQTAEEFGQPFTDSQKTQLIDKAVDAPEDPKEAGTAAGIKKGAQDLAELEFAKANGLSVDTGVESEFFGKQGEFKRLPERDLTGIIVTMMKGNFNRETGEASNLNEEQNKILPQIVQKAIKFLRPTDGKPAQAGSLTTAASLAVTGENLAIPKSDYELALDFVDEAKNPDKMSVAEGKSRSQALEKLQLSDATGITSGALNAWNEIAGQFLPTSTADAVSESRFQLRSLSYAYSVAARKTGGRVFLFDVQSLEDMARQPGVGKSAVATARVLKEQDRLLDIEVQDRLKMLRSGLLDPKARQKVSQDIAAIVEYQKRLRQFDLDFDAENDEKLDNIRSGKASFAQTQQFVLSKGKRGMRDLKENDPEAFQAVQDRLGLKPKKAEGGEPAAQVSESFADALAGFDDTQLSTLAEQAKTENSPVSDAIAAEVLKRAGKGKKKVKKK